MRSLMFFIFLLVFSNAAQAQAFDSIFGDTIKDTNNRGQKVTPEILMLAHKASANKINAMCPMNLGDGVRIDSASVSDSGMSLITHNTFTDVYSKNFNAKPTLNFFKKVKPELCLKYSKIIPLGAEYMYTYSSNDGIEIARLIINSNSCSNTESGYYFATIK